MHTTHSTRMLRMYVYKVHYAWARPVSACYWWDKKWRILPVGYGDANFGVPYGVDHAETTAYFHKQVHHLLRNVRAEESLAKVGRLWQKNRTKNKMNRLLNQNPCFITLSRKNNSLVGIQGNCAETRSTKTIKSLPTSILETISQKDLCQCAVISNNKLLILVCPSGQTVLNTVAWAKT